MDQCLFSVAPRCVNLPARLLRDENFSYRDLGVWVVLLSGEMSFGGYRALARRAGCGQSGCRSALRRLEAAGLFYRFEIVEAGKARVVSIVFPVPVDEACARTELIRQVPGMVIKSRISRSLTEEQEILPEGRDKKQTEEK